MCTSNKYSVVHRFQQVHHYAFIQRAHTTNCHSFESERVSCPFSCPQYTSFAKVVSGLCSRTYYNTHTPVNNSRITLIFVPPYIHTCAHEEKCRLSAATIDGALLFFFTPELKKWPIELHVPPVLASAPHIHTLIHTCIYIDIQRDRQNDRDGQSAQSSFFIARFTFNHADAAARYSFFSSPSRFSSFI